METDEPIPSCTIPYIKGLPFSDKQYTRMFPELPGFGIRVGRRTKTFVLSVVVNGKRLRNVAIGRFGHITPAKALVIADERLAELKHGIKPKKPLGEPPPVEITFGELADAFIEKYATLKRKTCSTDQARIDRHLKHLRKLPISEITRGTIIELAAKIGSTDCHRKHCRARKKKCDGHPVEANRTVFLIQRIFEVGRDFELISENHRNPAAKVTDHLFDEPKKADRSASKDEVRRLHKAILTADNLFVRGVFWILLLTGLRKREALRLKWDEVNLTPNEITLPGRIKLSGNTALIPENKSNRTFKLPLASPTVALLEALKAEGKDSDWVFPSIPKKKRAGSVRPSESGHLESVDRQWRRIRTVAVVPELTMHDLRATVATWSSRRGEHDRTINAMLNQVPPRGVVSRYIDDSPDLLRKAFEKHAAEVLKAAGVKDVRSLVWPQDEKGADIIYLEGGR